jgi:hypothetical protein
MYGVCVLSVLSASGCAAESAEPELPPAEDARIYPTTCEPLMGIYRVTYARKNGDCAELPVQLAKFKDNTTISALSAQCKGTIETSANGCDRTEDGDCAIVDVTGVPTGSAHLSSIFKQTSEIRLEGSTTISLQTLDGVTTCSASYALIGDQVRDP